MKRCLAAFLLLCPGGFAQPIYDLLLKNGRVIDPANHRDAQLDLAMSGNRIVRVAANLPAAHARVVVDMSGYMVTPGLIDINTRFDGQLKPDYNTLPYGVTTAVDAGTANCQTFSDFKKRVIDPAKVRVLAFLAVTDAECTARVANQNKETVVGLAATASTERTALESANGLPVMTSRSRQLGPGNPSADEQRRGMLFDDSPLQFAMAQMFFPDVISSGMNWSNILLQRANMVNAMSIYLNLGRTVEQIVEGVTSNAARAIKRPQLGALNEGGVADIAVLEIEQGKFGLLDVSLKRLDATRRFRCLLTVRNGVIVWDSEGLSIPDAIRAGPYTNFK